MPTPISRSGFDRRSFLRLGGSAVALSAVVAACGSDDGAGPSNLIPVQGTRPPLATAGTPTVDNAVLLRTLGSLHHNATDVIAAVSAVGGLDRGVAALADTYTGLLTEQAKDIASMTDEAGGKPFSTSNPAVDERVVQPALKLLGVSETKAADAARLLYAFSQLLAETHQAFVPTLTVPKLRSEVMSIGAVHSRMAAAIAAAISPENMVSAQELKAAVGDEPAAAETTVAAGLPSTSAAAPPSTTASSGPADVELFVVPSAFGALSAVQVVLGKAGAEDTTKRQQLNIETPSLDSFAY